MSEVRGRSREDPMPEGWWPRGVTPHLRPGAVVERSYPSAGGQGLQPGGTTPVQGAVAAWAQDGLEELFHVQGQEVWW